MPASRKFDPFTGGTKGIKAELLPAATLPITPPAEHAATAPSESPTYGAKFAETLRKFGIRHAEHAKQAKAAAARRKATETAKRARKKTAAATAKGSRKAVPVKTAPSKRSPVKAVSAKSGTRITGRKTASRATPAAKKASRSTPARRSGTSNKRRSTAAKRSTPKRKA